MVRVALYCPVDKCRSSTSPATFALPMLVRSRKASKYNRQSYDGGLCQLWAIFGIMPVYAPRELRLDLVSKEASAPKRCCQLRDHTAVVRHQSEICL